MTGRTSVRRVMWALVPVELPLLIASAAGVPLPRAVVLFARILVVAAVVVETVLLLRGWLSARRRGLSRVAALRETAYGLLPRVAVRLMVHEVRCLRSIWFRVRRRTHGVGPGDHAAGYTAPQSATMWSLIGLSVVETAALAFLIPWPVVHLVLLVLGVYGTVFMVGMQAACAVRPHVAGADGSLRLRYGALFDLRIPAGDIVRVRIDRRFPPGGLITAHDDGSVDLAVGGQTNVAVDLVSPVTYTRPLGRAGTARTVRFHADDPQALVAALGGGVRTA
ncbi:hypothetical protein ABZ714_24890 [Streptomyces sp. NPDC006798]|uniref:hypothetical protein n=1 Tax=Streptomyces sp. NPDC006798 TaxID=3155462 RepID=UPI003406DD07